MPVRAAAAVARGIEPQAGDDGIGVTAVVVDGHPAALSGDAPAAELPRRQRALQQAGAVQRVGDGARAVVARVLPLAVAAAVLVWLADDPVGRGDRGLDVLRCIRRRGGVESV